MHAGLASKRHPQRLGRARSEDTVVGPALAGLHDLYAANTHAVHTDLELGARAHGDVTRRTRDEERPAVDGRVGDRLASACDHDREERLCAHAHRVWPQSEDYDHYRLFLGTDELVEHEVLSFVREQDGGTTTIDFTAGDGAATAWFPTPFSPELSPTLTIDGDVVEMVAVDPKELDDAVYLCR